MNRNEFLDRAVLTARTESPRARVVLAYIDGRWWSAFGDDVARTRPAQYLQAWPINPASLYNGVYHDFLPAGHVEHIEPTLPKRREPLEQHQTS